MPYNESLRDLLDQHMNDWRITDEGQRMEIRGWLKANGAMITVSGLREHVVSVVEGLVHSLLASGRIPT